MNHKCPEEYDLYELGGAITIPVHILKPGAKSYAYFKIFKVHSAFIKDSDEVKTCVIKFVFNFGHKNYNEDARQKLTML